jgi:hypothetical protein
MAAPKNAVPTPRGWVHEKTGELLKAQKLSASFIATWHGTAQGTVVQPTVPTKPVVHRPRVTKKVVEETYAPQTLHEAPADEKFIPASEHNYFATEIEGPIGEEE